MTFLLLLAGLILEIAGKHWFSGASTVGTILIIVGAVGIALQLLVFGGTLSAIRKKW